MLDIKRWKCLLPVLLHLLVLMSSILCHPIINVTEELPFNLFGKPGNGYYLEVMVGTPEQKFNVLVDTGSSNFAVSATPQIELDSYFVQNSSSSFVNIGTKINVVYTEGRWEGYMGRDNVRFPSLPGSVPIVADVALITKSSNFFINNSHWQGILGLAYPALGQPVGAMEPWFDAQVRSGKVNNSFLLQLCGPNDVSSHLGRFIVGGEQVFCPYPEVTTAIREPWFYEVLLVSVGVEGTPLDVPCVELNTQAAILDSGTSNLNFPRKVRDILVREMKLRTAIFELPLPDEFWDGRQELCWPKNNPELQGWTAFPNISIHLAHSNNTAFALSLTAQSYLRPSASENASLECWVLGINESAKGTVMGAVLMEGFCINFDRGHSVVGFSVSPCGPPVNIGQVYPFPDTNRCSYIATTVDGMAITAYIMGIVVTLMCLPLVLTAIKWICKRHRPMAPFPPWNSQVPFVALNETHA